MAMCPACDHQVRTPSVVNLDGWKHLQCPYCKARLEMKPPRSYLMAPVIAPLFVLARQGHMFEAIAFVYMFATIVLVLVESSRPKLRLRKRPLAKPSVWLKIGRPLH